MKQRDINVLRMGEKAMKRRTTWHSVQGELQSKPQHKDFSRQRPKYEALPSLRTAFAPAGSRTTCKRISNDRRPVKSALF